MNKQNRVFDLHCDTVSALYDQKLNWDNTALHLRADAVRPYDEYRQVLAVYSRNQLDDESCWQRYCDMVNHTLPALRQTVSPAFHGYLAVEGGKLLGGDLSRLDKMYADGVRILTLVWGGLCCVGGAHDTDEGLTPFGYDVVRRCLTLGIVPDVSHASDTVFRETAQLAKEAGKPFIASHSDSRALCAHSRNLTDEMFCTVRDAGGLTGVSLCRNHLSSTPQCTVAAVADHICHYLSMDGGNTVCLGCDLDGTAPLPDGLSTAADLYRIADELASRGISQTQIDRIFYANAADFFDKNNIMPVL